MMPPRRRAWGHLLSSLVALAACTLAASAASADEGDDDDDEGFTFSFDLFGGYYQASPAVTLRTPEFFTVESLKGVTFRPDHPVAYAGLGVDAQYHVPGLPLLYVPAVGLRAAWPFNWAVSTTYGPDGEGTAKLRDNINHLAYFLQLSGPGVGLEQRLGPIKLGGEIKPAITYLSVYGTISQGALSTDVRGDGLSFTLLGDVHACLDVGEPRWGCLFAAPTLYESSGDRWWNGLQFGLRVQNGKLGLAGGAGGGRGLGVRRLRDDGRAPARFFCKPDRPAATS